MCSNKPQWNKMSNWRCKGASGVEGFQNKHSFLATIQFNSKECIFVTTARVDGSVGAEQPWEQRLLSFSVFFSPGSWATILRGASQTFGTECGRVLKDPEGSLGGLSVCCSHTVESGLTGSPMILEQTFIVLCRHVWICRLMEWNQQVMEKMMTLSMKE